MKISTDTRNRMSESAKKRCTQQWREEKSRSLRSDLPVEEVKIKYEEGMTQNEIAAFFGVSQKAVFNLMLREGIARRKAIPRNQRGDANPNWKGADACGISLPNGVSIRNASALPPVW